MSNLLATNAVVPKSIATPHFLKATRDGFPLNKQVPRTYQVYAGTGNQTITYDGSNEVRITGQTLTGPLIINLGPLVNIRNNIGRAMTLNIYGPVNQPITLSSNPALLCINGTSLKQLSHVIAPDANSKSITVYFNSEQLINLDYGAAVVSIVPLGPTYTFANVGSGAGVFDSVSGSLVTFRRINGNYMQGTQEDPFTVQLVDRWPKIRQISPQFSYTLFTAITTQPVYFPVEDKYDVVYEPDGFYGDVSVLTTTISGIGYLDIIFTMDPKRRFTHPYDLHFTLYNTGDYTVHFPLTVTVHPNLSNVYESNFYSAMKTNGVIVLYDTSVGGNPPERNMLDTTGNVVDLGTNLICFCVCIKDNVMYYSFTGISDTTIYWYDFKTQTGGALFDLNSTSHWIAGAKIKELDYDENKDCIHVMSDQSTLRIVSLFIPPILTVPTVGTILGYSILLAAGSVPRSFAYDSSNEMWYVAFSPSVGNIQISSYRPQNTGTALSNVTTGYPQSANISMVIDVRGRLLLQASHNNIVVAYIRGILDSPINVHQPPTFYFSLSRNLYGFTQQ